MNLKKLIVGLAAVGLSLSLKAASVTVVLAANTATNVPTLLGTNAPSRILSVVAQSPANASPVVKFYDAPTSQLVFTNASYSVITSYATNLITTWTNYYGATNSFTNITLVDVTNTVAAATNSIAPNLIVQSPTNTTTVYNGLQIPYVFGIWASNSTAFGTATFTITYTQ